MTFEVGQRVRFKTEVLTVVGVDRDRRNLVGMVTAVRELPDHGWRLDVRFSDSDLLHGIKASQLEIVPDHEHGSPPVMRSIGPEDETRGGPETPEKPEVQTD